MMITGCRHRQFTLHVYLLQQDPGILSRSPRPFDAGADGMMVGEGIGMVLLKRLEDAERDGDKVYAVIRGIGASSDGRSKSIYAPRPEGQALATQRAYEQAGIPPTSVKLVEACGTGNVEAGDPAGPSWPGASIWACERYGTDHCHWEREVADWPYESGCRRCRVDEGRLALHHKILPPTNNVEKPNPKWGIEETPFYINTESRPWIQHQGEGPRRAGVSAFGFGGTNFHVVLEEHRSDHEGALSVHPVAQLLLLHAGTAGELLVQCQQVLGALQSPEGADAYKSSAAVSKTPWFRPRMPGWVSLPPQRTRPPLCLIRLWECCKRDSTLRYGSTHGARYRRSGVDWMAGLWPYFRGRALSTWGWGSDSRRELSSRAGSDRANGQFVL